MIKFKSKLLLLLLGMGYCSVASEILNTNNFDNCSLENWTLANSKVFAPGCRSGKCIQINPSRNGENSYLVSPMVTVNEFDRYNVEARIRGDGALRIHGWCYDAAGKYLGDIAEPHPGLRFSVTDKWERRGFRNMKLPAKTTTMRVCLENIGREPVFVDDFLFSKADDRSEQFKLKVNIDKTTVHVGEWLTASAVIPDELKKPNRFIKWGYSGRGPEWTYGWPEKIENNTFKSSPRAPGKYTLQALLSDEAGVLGGSNIEITVLPNQPPVAIAKIEYMPDNKIRLDASDSQDPDGDRLTAFRWSLPNGTVTELPVCILDADDLCAANVYLTVVDQWGLEGQREIEVQLPQVPQPVAPTLKDTFMVTIGMDGSVCVPAEFPITLRLGMLEYLPVQLTNQSNGTVSVVFTRGENGKTDHTLIRSTKCSVEAGETVQFSLPLQTILNSAHNIPLNLNIQNRNVVSQLNLSVTETYPIFGTQEHFNRTIPGLEKRPNDISQLAELPCQLYRLPDVLTWLGLKKEKAEQVSDFSKVDRYIDLLLNQGKTQIYPFLGYVPVTLRPLDENFAEKEKIYRAYVEEIVRRYKDRVHYWEPFNEPPWGMMRDWQNNGEKVIGRLTEILAEVVRAEDPSGKIVAPGYCKPADYPVIEDIIRNGGDKNVDIYNFHEYTSGPYYSGTDLKISFDGKVEQGYILRLLRLLQKWKIEKPIFVSECGGDYPPVNEEICRIKALQFLRTNLIWLAAGIKGIQQYELMDYPHESLSPSFSLMRYYDYYKFPMFYSFRETIKSLTGAETTGMVKNCDADVRYAEFHRGNETIIAIWNCSENVKDITISVPNGKIFEIQEKNFNYDGEVFITSKRKPISENTKVFPLQLAKYQVTFFSMLTSEQILPSVSVQLKD